MLIAVTREGVGEGGSHETFPQNVYLCWSLFHYLISSIKLVFEGLSPRNSCQQKVQCARQQRVYSFITRFGSESHSGVTAQWSTAHQAKTETEKHQLTDKTCYLTSQKRRWGKKSNSHMSVKGMHLLFKNCWSPCKQFCIKCTCKFAVSKYQHGKEKKSSESPSEIKAKCLWLLCNCPYHTLLRLKHSERVFEWENDRNWMHESERFNTLEVLRLKYHCQVFLWERGETQEGWDERNAEHQLRSRGEESRSKVVLWLPAHTNVPSVTEGQVMWSVAGQQARRINIVQGFLISVVFQMIKPSSGSWSEDFVFANSSPEEWLTS